jgi:hypothetical protein
MTRFPAYHSILRTIIVVVASLLASSWMQTPALAQHGHVGGAGRFAGGARVTPPHVFVPRVSPGMTLRRGFPVVPRPARFGTPRFSFRRRPIFLFGNPAFFGAPFFSFGFGFDSLLWPGCGQLWGWGLGCNDLSLNQYGAENYVTSQPYESSQYLYGGEGLDRILLYLKDGNVYSVTDYWVKDDQLHFTMMDENGAQLTEHAIKLDELDLQTTIDINSKRGFRLVLRNEPWQQYLRDHPDLIPPPLGSLPQHP